MIGLETLLDTAEMTRRVRGLFGSGAAGLEEAELLDCNPGQRAVIRYRLGSSPPALLYAKAFADAGRAVNAYRVLDRLHAAFAASPARLPEPVGVIEDLALVLYRPVRGRSLDQLATTAAMRAALEGAANWLAALHALDVVLERRLDVAHEAQSAGGWMELVADRHPASAGLARDLAQALVGTVPDFGAVVPIHKDFHYQHVIVGAPLGVIDLDEARMGDAAFDLGHFVAYLDLLAARVGAPAKARDEWRPTFLDTYAETAGASAGNVRWFEAYTCAKIAKQLATARGPRPRPAGAACRDELTTVLRRGLGTLR